MKRLVMTMLILLFANATYSQETNNYLITNDIGPYKKITKGGPSGNILAGADHFGLDHKDAAYGISYVNDETKMWIDVQVTQHASSDSDKWLLHEVERGFRDSDDEEGRLGLLHKGSRLVDTNNNKVLRFWSTYRWVSNYVVVVIDYGDPRKPEPLEVVQAYLQKFPSTIPSTLVLDRTHDEQWIKDEMERRLWLCDKWDAQFQSGKVQQNDLLRELVDHMTVFLDYREKYYGMKARDEKIALSNYLYQNDLTSIKNKLTDYKTWWSANKNNAIILP